MRKRLAVSNILLLGFVVLSIILIGCQPKEVTSAKVYMQQENWAKAIEQLTHAAELYPYNAEVFYLLGKAYVNTGDKDKMNEMFNKSLEISPVFSQKIKSIREKQKID